VCCGLPPVDARLLVVVVTWRWRIVVVVAMGAGVPGSNPRASPPMPICLAICYIICLIYGIVLRDLGSFLLQQRGLHAHMFGDLLYYMFVLTYDLYGWRVMVVDP
jgi:hypothetical protein